jgi:lipopolysaccharide export system permease protein
MNILHRYVLRQALVTLLVTLAVFTFVLLMGQLLKELSKMMVNQRIGPGAAIMFVMLILPYVLSFSLPMAMLATSLLVFGRLSADNEITAMRASGIGLGQVIAPVILLATAMTAVCLLINAFVAPACKTRMRTFFLDQAMDNPMAMLAEGVEIREFPGYLVYVGRRNIQAGTLENIVIYTLDDRGAAISKVTADRARVTIDAFSQKLRLDLENVRGDMRDPKDPTNISKIRPGIRAQRYPMELDLSQVMSKLKQEKKRMSDCSITEVNELIKTYRKRGKYPAEETIEIHKRLSLATACLAFTFVGIPLGIKTNRRETSIGMALSLGLAMVYYMVLILASALKEHPNFYPEAMLWVPNLTFQLIGLWLIRKVSRG